MKDLRIFVIGLVATLALVASCGGSKTPDGSGGTVGNTHVTPGTLDDAGLPVVADDAGLADAALPPAPVTFVLHNTAEEDLVLNMDRGYQPILFAYSGEPPNAESILMFPTHCTATCEAADEERCPVCEEPERVADIRAAQKLEYIKPGESREVPWDGQIFVYEKTRGKNAKGRKTRCKCWTQEPVPAETYTVKSCGLRLTSTAKSSSKYQCVEGTMTLPADEPIRVELEFPAPATK